MQHLDLPATEAAVLSPDGAEGPARGRAILVADRALPRWAAGLSAAFALLRVACILAIAISTLFFQDIAALSGQPVVAALIAAVAAVPALGLIATGYARNRALAGLRDLRQGHAVRAEAALAGLCALALALVHPALAMAALAGPALHLLVLRMLIGRARREPAWDQTPEEAASVLAGRDARGFALAAAIPRDHALQSDIGAAMAGLAVVASFAAASALAARGILSPAALPPIGLISLWAGLAMMRFSDLRLSAPLPGHVPAREVRTLDQGEQPTDLSGLEVTHLTVTDPAGRLLLADIGFSLQPGTILGVLGDSSAGKSLLLQALAAPLDLSGLAVQGSVRQRGADLWGRSAEGRRPPAALVPAQPLILAASGAENLTCFRDDLTGQGRALIEALTFSSDEAQAICDAPDATLLSGGQRKILALARAFLMAPELYLLDRPEDQLPDRAIAAIAARLRQETRLGRSFVMVTTNRALLEVCDRLVVLQEGRVVDFGQAAEIRAKMSSGWSRFVGSRSLESEENLIRWVRAQFKRPGDETNRRNLGMVASELLAFSCQTNDRPERRDVTFEYKHFEGHGQLRMIDDSGPLTTGQIARARKEAGGDPGLSRLSPLAAVVRGCLDISGTVENDRRVISLRVATYDPRKSPAPLPEGDRDRA